MLSFRIAPTLSTGKRQMIGTICVNWSIVEFFLHKLVWRVEGLADEDGVTKTKQLDIDKLRKMLEEKSKLLKPEDGEELRCFMRRLEDLQLERNRIVHAFWSLDKKNHLRAVIFRDGKFQGPNPMNFATMKATNQRIVDLGQEIFRFLESKKPRQS